VSHKHGGGETRPRTCPALLYAGSDSATRFPRKQRRRRLKCKDCAVAKRGIGLQVRLLVYNIRYATGTGPAFHLPVPGAGYLRTNRKVLSGITEFIRAEGPDVVGLIEVDTGSIRSGMVNQAEHIAGELGHFSTYQCKYAEGSINTLMPIVRKQGNAFLSAPTVHGERFHYFDTGIKRLIIELELSEVCVFLVHLSLKFRQRQYQLRSLHDLIVQAAKPVIVAGDFNTFWGTHEIYLFMRAAGLRSANTAGLPSFPARVPRIELDFILVSEGIEVTDFRIPDVRFSDHRPLVCDFRVDASARRAASAA
jgi:endonuclease/exonuclease/phosphatase family metal-dependent hydrolase